MFAKLSKVAQVSLGYKSLQNNFFYVNRATIDTYGIEKKFLMPMLMLKDLDASVFEQSSKPTLWLFACRQSRADLRGTGAWRYIEAMAHHAAAEKKQGAENKTIQEVLEAQGGGIWYAPKAKPSRHNVWLRKAINGVYAPLLFQQQALVDQRLNSVQPLDGVTWEELAAAFTSSLFTYSLEINGSASMGAGALETPTTKLRDYPVLDITLLSASNRAKLVSMAKAVWAAERPIDWSASQAQPGPKLMTLDKWLLGITKADVTVSQLHSDIHETCLARIAVADDKKRKTKKVRSDSIGSVAEAIVKSFGPKISTKNFPEDFAHNSEMNVPYQFDRKSLKEVAIHPLLDNYELEITMKTGEVAHKGSYPRPVAEAMVRAILWGRSTFSVSSDRALMEGAVKGFLDWGADVEKDIEEAINSSTLGTGYRDALKREVYSRLGIHPASFAKALPNYIAL